MKDEKKLTELLDQARNQAPDIPAGKIIDLVEQGIASPLAAKHSLRPRRIRIMFNPLKIILMITPIIVITATLFLFNSRADKVQTEKGLNFDQNSVEAIVPKPQSPDKKLVTRNVLGKTAAKVKHIVKDTVFRGVILDLSKEELGRLGFLFDEEGYYYLNKLPDGSTLNFWSHQPKTNEIRSGKNGVAYFQIGAGSFGLTSGEFTSQANKCALQENDYYPVLSTNLNGEDLLPIDQIQGQVYDEFTSMNDTLVPVLFTRAKFGGYDADDRLIWFKVSEGFYSRLSGEQIKQSQNVFQSVIGLKKTGPEKDRVHFIYPGIPNPTPIIRLKADVLRCMGFIISEKMVEYEFNKRRFDWKFSIDSVGTVYSSNLTYVGPPKLINEFLKLLLVYGITDERGNFSAGYNPQSSDPTIPTELATHINVCLPIQIDEENIPQKAKEAIFWIYPSEKFFTCLPPDIAIPMKKEFKFRAHASDVIIEFVNKTDGTAENTPLREIMNDTINTEREPVPCVYFTNLCESIPGLDYVNLYPNPAADQLNIDLILQRGKKMNFRVFDLGGRLLSDEKAPEVYSEGGQYKHQLEIARLQPGLYLLVITDDEGARMTRRFVKN